MLVWTSTRSRRATVAAATVATPGEWQCKTGGVRRLAVAMGPTFFKCVLFIFLSRNIITLTAKLLLILTSVLKICFSRTHEGRPIQFRKRERCDIGTFTDILL